VRKGCEMWDVGCIMWDMGYLMNHGLWITVRGKVWID